VSDEAADGDAPQQAPPKKRKKKRKAEPEASRERELPTQEQEVAPRPQVAAFIQGFPRDPELDLLVDAFERGNYAAVRAGAGRLSKEAERAEVRRAAGELLRRIEPDRLAVMLLLAAAGLLLFFSIWYWSHGGHAP
jgi:hypothetical protein